MSIYELYGRQAEELLAAQQAWAATLQLLRDLKSGVRRLEDVEVSDEGWKVTPGEAP